VSVDDFGLTAIEKTLEQRGVRIKNRELLKRAFTHDSYIGDGHPESQCNEELEFLGDAVLSLIVSDYLFKRGIRTEGRLTKIRSALVRNERLVGFATNLGVGEVLRLSRGEIKIGGRQNPRILSGCFEALVAVLYRDRGLKVAKKFVEDTVLIEADQLINGKLEDDSKSRLNEYLQRTSKMVPMYSVLNQEGPDHSKTFEVAVYSADGKRLGIGKGESKQKAEEDAASNALKLLQQ
jgi:ribonuclease-3